jgi:nucleotide-binding universal stress UspA family protein
MFGTVMLAVDGSEHAKHATALAAKLASASGDRVVVVHYIERFITRGGAYDLETRAEADEMVDKHVEVLRGVGVSTSSRVEVALKGAVPRALTQAAEELDAGLIVVGSRGLTDLGSMLLGGVTHKLLHLTGRPVLVAR